MFAARRVLQAVRTLLLPPPTRSQLTGTSCRFSRPVPSPAPSLSSRSLARVSSPSSSYPSRSTTPYTLFVPCQRPPFAVESDLTDVFPPPPLSSPRLSPPALSSNPPILPSAYARSPTFAALRLADWPSRLRPGPLPQGAQGLQAQARRASLSASLVRREWSTHLCRTPQAASAGATKSYSTPSAPQTPEVPDAASLAKELEAYDAYVPLTPTVELASSPVDVRRQGATGS